MKFAAPPPLGFTATEISSLVNEEVVSQHAEEAAFLWTLRNRATGAANYSLKDLAGLDERVEAHLDGLMVAGNVGWIRCRTNLDLQGPGEVFVAGVLAFLGGIPDRMSEALLAGSASSRALKGLVSSLAWVDYKIASRPIAKLLSAKSALHRMVGLAACAVHRVDPGAALIVAVDDDDPSLRARSLRAVGELKRYDLVDRVRNHLIDDDEGCRFWAAWALAMNRDDDGSKLLPWFGIERFSVTALQLALRAMSLADAREWIRAAVRDQRFTRLAIIGAGVIGDPASVPWLIRRMEDPKIARVAGEAFTTITGADLTLLDLTDDSPPGDSEEEEPTESESELEYDSSLPWPSPSRVSKWWETNGQILSNGVRHLVGKPITAASLIEVIKMGKQRQRAAAALEMALLDKKRPLFEVRARGDWQEQRVLQWTL